MIHQFHNWQTDALFRLVYNEPVLDRNFYGKDKKEKFLTIAWNRGAGQALLIDNISYPFPANTIHCLMVSETFQFESPSHIVAWQFNRDFYCMVDHDKEVSCIGFIFYGPPQKMFIRLNETDERRIENLLYMLQEEFKTSDKIQKEMLQTLLKQLIIIVTRLAKDQFIDQDGLPTDKLDIVRNYNFLVETHFRYEHRVKFYADKLAKSPKTLSNLFAIYNNKSPLQIIHERIMMEAKRLIFYTDKSAKTIAYELGFENAGHFGKLFKKHTGQSVTEFKKTNDLAKIVAK